MSFEVHFSHWTHVTIPLKVFIQLRDCIIEEFAKTDLEEAKIADYKIYLDKSRFALRLQVNAEVLPDSAKGNRAKVETILQTVIKNAAEKIQSVFAEYEAQIEEGVPPLTDKDIGDNWMQVPLAAIIKHLNILRLRTYSHQLQEAMAKEAPFTVIGHILHSIKNVDSLFRTGVEFNQWIEEAFGFSTSKTHDLIISYKVYKTIADGLKDDPDAKDIPLPKYQRHCNLLSQVPTEKLVDAWKMLAREMKMKAGFVSLAWIAQFLQEKGILHPKAARTSRGKRAESTQVSNSNSASVSVSGTASVSSAAPEIQEVVEVNHEVKIEKRAASPTPSTTSKKPKNEIEPVSSDPNKELNRSTTTAAPKEEKQEGIVSVLPFRPTPSPNFATMNPRPTVPPLTRQEPAHRTYFIAPPPPQHVYYSRPVYNAPAPPPPPPPSHNAPTMHQPTHSYLPPQHSAPTHTGTIYTVRTAPASAPPPPLPVHHDPHQRHTQLPRPNSAFGYPPQPPQYVYRPPVHHEQPRTYYVIRDGESHPQQHVSKSDSLESEPSLKKLPSMPSLLTSSGDMEGESKSTAALSGQEEEAVVTLAKFGQEMKRSSSTLVMERSGQTCLPGLKFTGSIDNLMASSSSDVPALPRSNSFLHSSQTLTERSHQYDPRKLEMNRFIADTQSRLGQINDKFSMELDRLVSTDSYNAYDEVMRAWESETMHSFRVLRQQLFEQKRYDTNSRMESNVMPSVVEIAREA